MRPFQSAYIGRHDFPRGLGEFELRQWFTLSIRDRRSIRKAFRSRHWIGAALHSGFIAMTGTTLRSLEVGIHRRTHSSDFVEEPARADGA
jgi:hypothetical protein